MTGYQDATYGVGNILYTRIARPWLYSNLIYNLTKYRKREREYLKILHQFTMNVIKERDRTFSVSDVENLVQEHEEWEVYSKKRFAMLDLLLLAKRSGEIDDAGIMEEVNTFMFAGHDTVSMGLSFCLFMLANHKHIQYLPHETFATRVIVCEFICKWQKNVLDGRKEAEGRQDRYRVVGLVRRISG
ncbi:Cytochrome P450 4c3 [Carabus blaptoides fortunei]